MLLYRVLKFICTPIMRLIMPFKVYKKERVIKQGGALYICNHYRKMDIIYVASLDKRPVHFIGKAELFKTRIGKWLFNKVGVIPVNRDSQDIGALLKGLKFLKEDKKLSLFPEGRRNRGDEDLMEIRGGAGLFAVKSKKPIQPVMQYKKARFFRFNYLIVGEPFELSQYYGKKLTSADFSDINQIMREKLLELKKELIETLKQKGKIKCK